MMRLSHCARCVLTAALILATLTACTPTETQVIVALFDEWAREKGFNPKDEKGEWDLMGVVGVLKTGVRVIATGTTGDAESDAAVGIIGVVYPIKECDEATDKGLDTRDPKKIDGAIRSRPDDYHYRNALGAVLLANGDEGGARAAFREAGDAWKRNNPKWSSDYGDQVNTRDILGCLDRSIRAEKQNGTSDAGKTAMRMRYCEEAIRYYNQTKSAHYLKRARDVLGIDCSNY